MIYFLNENYNLKAELYSCDLRCLNETQIILKCLLSCISGIWEGGYYLKCSVAATEYGWKMGWKMIARNNRIWLAIQ